MIVGSEGEIRELGAATETIDLDAAVVVPGLTDSHIHPLQGALDTRGADLRDLSSLEDVRGAIAAERVTRVDIRDESSIRIQIPDLELIAKQVELSLREVEQRTDPRIRLPVVIAIEPFVGAPQARIAI